ncbi:MAG TPA: NUDIX domain-containing protein [Candidatus Saccharimonadales bacterium]|nr:NUDIX domain-containing protein [Candidatus Saccharimonadales bacterium]
MTNLKERLTIVDEHDNEIGEAPKGDVWKKGLIHRVVWGIAYGPDGKILVQRRAGPDKKPLYPSCIDVSWSGHVQVGQSYDETAHAEAEEELGLHDLELEKLGTSYSEATFQAAEPVGRIVMRKFGAVYKTHLSELPTNLQESEVAGVEWWTVNETKAFVQEHPDQVTDGLKIVATEYL